MRHLGAESETVPKIHKFMAFKMGGVAKDGYRLSIIPIWVSVSVLSVVLVKLICHFGNIDIINVSFKKYRYNRCVILKISI